MPSFCTTTEWAAPAGCGLLSRRAGPERASPIQRWKRWDPEEAQPGQPPALSVPGRPSGTWKSICLPNNLMNEVLLIMAFTCFYYLLFIHLLCPLASWGWKRTPEDTERADAEKSGGVGEGDGEDDRWVQQDEDCCTANWLRYGPAQEREGSCKATSKVPPYLTTFLFCILFPS